MVSQATADSLSREIIRDFNLPDPPPDTRLMVEQSRWLKGGLLNKLTRSPLALLREQTTRAGLPSEIALLPLSRTRLPPAVQVPKVWQFMDGTAQEYRLKTQGQCDDPPDDSGHRRHHPLVDGFTSRLAIGIWRWQPTTPEPLASARPRKVCRKINPRIFGPGFTG